jgi:hypothetical protein
VELSTKTTFPILKLGLGMKYRQLGIIRIWQAALDVKSRLVSKTRVPAFDETIFYDGTPTTGQ